MKTYQQTLTAGQTVSFLGGDVFVLVSTTADVDVALKRKNQDLPESASGVQAGFKARPRKPDDVAVGFDEVKITSATAQTVKVAVGLGDVDYNVIGGSLEVRTALTNGADFYGDDADSNNEYSFVGDGIQVAVAAQYSYTQLWNAGGSGIVVLLDGITFSQSSGAGALIQVQHNVAALTNPYNNPSNKKIGAAAPTTKIRFQASASNLGSTFMTYSTRDDETLAINFKRPIVIPESKGILIKCSTLNVKLVSTYSYREFVF